MRESDLSSQLILCLCQAYTGWYSDTSECAEASAEVGEGPHGWACAGSFPVACGCSLL